MPIKKKRYEFFYFLCNNSVDISIVSETHLSSEVTRSHPDYLKYRLDRKDDVRGGGAAIFVKRSVKHKLLPYPMTEVIEALSSDVLANGKKFVVSSIYFPGSKKCPDDA